MSLFTSALAGAGRAAADLADTYVKQEVATNLEQLRADLEMKKLERANELAVQRDREAQRARVDAEKEIADYKVSPDYVGRAAEATGRVKRAETDATGYTLNPGDKRYVGGQPVAENQRPTSQEVARDYGRGGSGESRRQQPDGKVINDWVKTLREMPTPTMPPSLAGAVAMRLMQARNIGEHQAIDLTEQIFRAAVDEATEKAKKEGGKPEDYLPQMHALIRQRFFGDPAPAGRDEENAAPTEEPKQIRPRGPSLLDRAARLFGFGTRGGETLNEAWQRLQNARRELEKFGLAQRRENNERYRAALAEYEAAKTEYERAKAERPENMEPTPDELEKASRPSFGVSRP